MANPPVSQEEQSANPPHVKAGREGSEDLSPPNTEGPADRAAGARDAWTLSDVASDQGSQEDHIRRRAYQIWEEEGRPTDRADEHWARAEEEIRRMTHKMGRA